MTFLGMLFSLGGILLAWTVAEHCWEVCLFRLQERERRTHTILLRLLDGPWVIYGVAPTYTWDAWWCDISLCPEGLVEREDGWDRLAPFVIYSLTQKGRDYAQHVLHPTHGVYR